MNPGFRLRQARERLGLTYRDVQRASRALAETHTRPQFAVQISRLADIENAGVVPSLHKLYALSVVYHLSPLDIFRWYDIPLDRFLGDSISFAAPETHLMASPELGSATGFVDQTVRDSGGFGNFLGNPNITASNYRYGCIGLNDRRMDPILRPGSVVLIDVAVHRLQEFDWFNEYDRPLYFVELHDGYRCGWFQQEGTRLAMQPHPLSRCMPESWKTPDEAEIVGRVVSVLSRLPVRSKAPSPESPELPAHSSKKAL